MYNAKILLNVLLNISFLVAILNGISIPDCYKENDFSILDLDPETLHF